MAAVATVSSASGILAMLQEPAEELKLHALASLNAVVHLFYPEISTSIPTM
jgi:26S proteasome regulatory subunit N2